MANNLLLVFGAFLLGLSLEVSAENYYTELETLKPPQKETLRKFKALVEKILPHDYMKEDIYLVKYLKFENFNLARAENHLKESLKWRKDNKVDEYVKELPPDMAAFQQDYPIYLDGYDKENRPICEMPVGQWSIRKAAAAGLTKRLILYFLITCAERATEKVREQQAKGKNVTEFIFLANLDGYTVAEQACPTCLPFTVAIATANDRYWPLGAHGFWLVNTPDAFAILLRIVRAAFSPQARAVLKTFTSNPAEWKPYLEKRVHISQISDWYGEGGKVRKPY